MVGEDSLFSEQFVKNRLNPKAYSVFSLLLGKKELLCNHDRCAFFRPTLWPTSSGLQNDNCQSYIKGQLEKKTKWDSTKNIHIDMNPWWYLKAPNSSEVVKQLNKINFGSKNDFKYENNTGSLPSLHSWQATVYCEKDKILSLQALFNLEDNLPEDGGNSFGEKGLFLQDFNWYLDSINIWGNGPNVAKVWEEGKLLADSPTEVLLRYFKPGKNPPVFIIMPENLALQKQAIRISSRKGSLVIWNQLTLHGSAPNNSTRPRLVYLVLKLTEQIRTIFKDVRCTSNEPRALPPSFDMHTLESLFNQIWHVFFIRHSTALSRSQILEWSCRNCHYHERHSCAKEKCHKTTTFKQYGLSNKPSSRRNYNKSTSSDKPSDKQPTKGNSNHNGNNYNNHFSFSFSDNEYNKHCE